MNKSAALTGLAALSLLEISAATPAVAQNVEPFLGNYFGFHTGYFAGNGDFSSSPYNIVTLGPGLAPARNDSFDPDGFLVGLQGGTNFSLGGNLVGGIEGDITRLGGDDNVAFNSGVIGADGLSFQYRSVLDYEWQGTIRGRFGVVQGNVLFFATGGVAFLNAEWSEPASKSLNFGAPITFNHSDSETLVGGVVGGGFEYAISPTVIVGADYLYENFENSGSVPHGVEPGQTGKLDDIDVHKVRFRVSVKFGGPQQ